jgi:hypothetical protein
MGMGIALLIAYTPFFWWVFKQAKEDFSKNDKIMRRINNEKNSN